MSKLNDLQTLLLSTASQRETASLLPLPDGTAGVRATKAVMALAKSGLAEERETVDADAIIRTDGDLHFGLFITAAGFAAIGIEPENGGEAENGGERALQADTPAAAPARATKTATVLALLARDDGATVAELIAATGWLPHTTRAALTGLRKKGHAITRGKRGDQTCYTVAAA